MEFCVGKHPQLGRIEVPCQKNPTETLCPLKIIQLFWEMGLGGGRDQRSYPIEPIPPNLEYCICKISRRKPQLGNLAHLPNKS
jgi:hypothetical protein